MRNSSKSQIDISIIIPCLNEEKHIKNTLTKLVKSFSGNKHSFELLVVNDGSNDSTLDEIRDFQINYPEINLKIYNHKKSTGIGFIFYKYSRKVKGDYCRMVMGDDVDHIKTHKNILRFIHKYDIIIPIYNNVVNKSKTRMIISKLFTLIVNIISFSKIGYYNGSVAFRTNHLKKVKFIDDGFGFQAEIITKLIKVNSNYIEFNASALHRDNSNSITIKNLIKVIHIILRIIKC